MNKKRNIFISLIFCITLITFIACGEKKEESTSITESMKDEIFQLKLYIDKHQYTKDEIINCYATLEYIGEEDSITIYHGDPLVGFALKDEKYFDGSYGQHTILLSTTIKKGEILRFDFSKSGGWSGDDPNADFYQEFFSEKELFLPEGTYEVSATIECSFDNDDVQGSKYSKSVSAEIAVIN